MRRVTPRDARGSASVELVVLAPVLLLFLMLAVYGGRLALARQAVQAAAADAARSASISRTAAQASANARSAASATLQSEGLECFNSVITVETNAFGSRVGTSGAVTATVTCSLNLAGLGVPGVPTVRHLSATAVSPIDTYRER